MSDPHDPRQASAEAGAPSEDELRAAYEAELARITAVDMIAQTVVSLLNIGARRLGPPPAEGRDTAPDGAAGRDLEQARDAIDGARALLEILDRRIPGELGPLKDALSRLQMAYAQEVGATGPAAGGPASSPDPGAGQQPGGAQPPAEGEGGPRRGPAESSGRLWVPGQ